VPRRAKPAPWEPDTMDWRSHIPKQVRQLATRALRVFDPHAALSYSQEGEDMILRRIFAGKAAGFYVDVGAHHPFRFSNTCLLSELGWRGINIDADPTLIAAFNRHRPRDTNLSMGVSDAPGTLMFHIFNEPALNTFDPAVAEAKARLPGYRILSTRKASTSRCSSRTTGANIARAWRSLSSSPARCLKSWRARPTRS
jgi:hypothetical protein